jgi:cytochrome c peroxidase
LNRFRFFVFAALIVATAQSVAAVTESGASAQPAPLGGTPLTPIERLGRKLFFDTKLSNPAGQSCASCHSRKRAFTDRDGSSPTSGGAEAGVFGKRNAPTIMYSQSEANPALAFDSLRRVWVGGLFWDGRVDSLEEQAKQPLLNPIEMANPTKEAVVRKVRRSSYRRLFRRVFGADAFANSDAAFDNVAAAIAAFERSARFEKFSSKFDAVRAGQLGASLTDQEAYGLDLFNQLGCAVCHPILPVGGQNSPGTDFSYRNIGIPKNPANPFYGMSSAINPDGANFVDIGLGAHFAEGSAERRRQLGKFKVPTVRNVALTAPYGHNGYFKTLKGIVEFYNSRDTKPRCADDLGQPVEVPEDEALRRDCWPAFEVAANVDAEIRGGAPMGGMGLLPEDVDAIVAFLNTLTDGWLPDPAP